LHTLPLRLPPGADLRREIERAVAGLPGHGGFVLSGIGSLAQANLRFAAAESSTLFVEPLEVLSLAGGRRSGAGVGRLAGFGAMSARVGAEYAAGGLTHPSSGGLLFAHALIAFLAMPGMVAFVNGTASISSPDRA
jgi:hypothetical protein